MREILIASLFKPIKQEPYQQEKHILTRHRNFWGMLQPKNFNSLTFQADPTPD